MTSYRLNPAARRALNNLVTEIVHSPETQAAVETAYRAARDRLIPIILERFPSDDMAVLRRYDCIETADYIDICLDNDNRGWARFAFHEGEAPTRPERGRVGLIVDFETFQLVVAWSHACDTHRETLSGIRGDYSALIRSAKTFEEVVEVWPEAEQCRSRIRGLPVVANINPDLIARLRADMARRAAETPAVETVSTGLDTP